MARKPSLPEPSGPVNPCPGCGGNVPDNLNPGASPGPLSQYDGATEVCTVCSRFERLSASHGIRLTAPGRAAAGVPNFAGGRT